MIADPEPDHEGNQRPWKPPAQIAPDLAQQAGALAIRLKQTTKPDKPWLEGRIMALMSHFYQVGMPAVMWSHIGEDWWKAIGHFARGVIEAACDEWIATGTHKPTPAHIRKIAEIRARNREIKIERLEILARQSSASGDIWPAVRNIIPSPWTNYIKAANPKRGTIPAHIVTTGPFVAEQITGRYGKLLESKQIAVTYDGQSVFDIKPPVEKTEPTDAQKAEVDAMVKNALRNMAAAPPVK